MCVSLEVPVSVSMATTRKQRSRREATFLESVKLDLFALRYEIIAVKKLMESFVDSDSRRAENLLPPPPPPPALDIYPRDLLLARTAFVGKDDRHSALLPKIIVWHQTEIDMDDMTFDLTDEIVEESMATVYWSSRVASDVDEEIDSFIGKQLHDDSKLLLQQHGLDKSELDIEARIGICQKAATFRADAKTDNLVAFSSAQLEKQCQAVRCVQKIRKKCKSTLFGKSVHQVQTTEKVVPAPSLQYQQAVKQMPRVMTRKETKRVPVTPEQTMEKMIEVPQVQVVENVTLIPQTTMQEIKKSAPVPLIQAVEKVVEGPQVQTTEKVVPVSSLQYQQVVEQVVRSVPVPQMSVQESSGVSSSSKSGGARNRSDFDDSIDGKVVAPASGSKVHDDWNLSLESLRFPSKVKDLMKPILEMSKHLDADRRPAFIFNSTRGVFQNHNIAEDVYFNVISILEDHLGCRMASVLPYVCQHCSWRHVERRLVCNKCNCDDVCGEREWLINDSDGEDDDANTDDHDDDDDYYDYDEAI